MSNELAIITPNNVLAQEAGATYCSIKADGDRAKAGMVYNALNNPDDRVSNIINKTIEIADVLIEAQDILDEETGEIERVPRVVLFDKGGKSYQAISVGILSSIKNLVLAYGEPTWNPPIPVTVKQVPTKRGSMLTLIV